MGRFFASTQSVTENAIKMHRFSSDVYFALVLSLPVDAADLSLPKGICTPNTHLMTLADAITRQCHGFWLDGTPSIADT